MHQDRRALITAALGLATTRWSVAQATPYPSKPVRIVVPFASGGGLDAMSRRVAQRLSDNVGKSFFVENKAGASGVIGIMQVVQSVADGSTLLANDGSYTMLPWVLKSLPWNHDADLIPITNTSVSPAILAVSASSRFSSVPELVTHARANPDDVTYGSGGIGSSLHFATERFAQLTGIRLRHIPFKGAGEATVALAGGTIDMVMGGPSSVLSLQQGGKVRALAVGGDRRIPVLPHVSTFKELGIDYRMTYWTGLAAPRGTPLDVIKFLEQQVAKVMAAEDLQKSLAAIGAEPGGLTSEEFARFVRDETLRWKEVAARAGIRPE